MELKKIKVSELKNFDMASFQRETKSIKVKRLYEFYIKKGFFDTMPILVSETNKIIDGGHRSSAYIKAFEDGYVKDEVFILIKKGANKDTFLNVNKGTPVSINHKVKIHSKIEYLLKKGYNLSYKTSPLSLSYVDLARALCIINQIENSDNIRQSNPDYIESTLNKISLENIEKNTDFIFSIKDKYFNSLILNPKKRFLQKLFLYFVFIEKKRIDIKQSIYDKVVGKLPNGLSGDIGIAYNKQLFIDAYNFNFKLESNRIDLNIFN